MTDELAGTWVFNDSISLPNNSTKLSYAQDEVGNTYTFDFVCGDSTYIGIIAYSSNFSTGTNVYSNSSWVNESYKTITITSKLSEVTNGDTLLTWLQANATKQ